MEDSVTMTVEHIFMQTSKYEDSTIMHFRTTFKYDSQAKTIHDIIQIKAANGRVANNAYIAYAYISANENYFASQNYYIIRPDKIQIHVIGPDGMSGSVFYLGAILEKQ